MKYKRQVTTGMFTLALLLGKSSYYPEESVEVRNSKLGVYKSQVQMKSNYLNSSGNKSSKNLNRY